MSAPAEELVVYLTCTDYSTLTSEGSIRTSNDYCTNRFVRIEFVKDFAKLWHWTSSMYTVLLNPHWSLYLSSTVLPSHSSDCERWFLHRERSHLRWENTQLPCDRFVYWLPIAHKERSHEHFEPLASILRFVNEKWQVHSVYWNTNRHISKNDQGGD